MFVHNTVNMLSNSDPEEPTSLFRKDDLNTFLWQFVDEIYVYMYS
jgi:hypothetical protein